MSEKSKTIMKDYHLFLFWERCSQFSLGRSLVTICMAVVMMMLTGFQADGELPGWLVGAVLVVTVLSSAFLCWYAASRSDGEITDLRGSHREQWRI